MAARMEQLASPGAVRLTADTLKLAEGYVEVPVKGLAARAAAGAAPAALRHAAVEDHLHGVVAVERAAERLVEGPAAAAHDEQEPLHLPARHRPRPG